jgi:hypothetical protein
MTRALKSATRGSRGPNFAAFLVTASVVTYVYLNSDPVISGTEPQIGPAAVIGPPEIHLPPPPPRAEPSTADATAAGEIASTAATTASPVDSNVLTGRWAMLFSVTLLEHGCAKFERIPDYTATMYKQERINGELLDGQTMQMKLRHEPLSVYMKWLTGDKGRQVIYVDGQNDGNLLVQLGGVKGRLLGTLSVDPNGSQALAESRYPITGAGLLNLARKVLEHRHRDLERNSGCRCEIHDNQTLNDRPCFLFVTTYDSPEISATYRKSMLYIDKELSMPVCVRNYTWANEPNPETLDEDTLIEFYSYSDIQHESRLGDGDFDRTNEAYKMRR